MKQNQPRCVAPPARTIPPSLFSLKKLIFVLFCMVVCTTVQAAISLEGITPTNDSEISSFDFTLHFDLSEAKADYPDKADNLGIGYSGDSEIGRAALYKGNQDSGELLGTALTSNVTGKSEELSLSGDVSFSFEGVNPESGATYTLVITNMFSVYEKGGKTLGKNYRLDYETTPLVYTFIGKSDSANFSLLSSSILKDSKLESFKNVELTFNLPVAISDNAKAMLLQDEEVYANTSSFIVDPENECAVIISFNNIPLYKNITYTFVCEAGSIVIKDDPSKTNELFTLSIQGVALKPFTVKKLNPETVFNGILTSASVQFELPEKGELLETYGASKVSYPATLYKVIGNEKEEVANLKGSPLSSGDGVIWEINCEIIPETEYLINVPANSISAYVPDATAMSGYKRIADMSNEEINFSFNTPSLENSNLPKLEFGVPFTSDSDGRNRVEYPVNSEVSEFGYLNLELKDKFYRYNGSSFRLVSNDDNETTFGTLYKVDESGKRIKVKDIECGGSPIYTSDDFYRIAVLVIESRLYENSHYQIVIPAGTYTVNNEVLKHFIQNEEIVLDYYGNSDSNLSLACTSVRDGERMSTVSAVSFISDQELALTNPSARMVLRIKDGENLRYSAYHLGKDTYEESGTGHQTFTRIMGDFSNAKASIPYTLPETDDEYQIVIAPGTFSLANDPEITNEEIVVNIKRVPETGLPEYVNLTSVVNEHAATVHPIEKGLKAKLQLTPSEDWRIERVVFNGKDVTANVDEDGNYETPAVRIDSRMEVHLAYNGDIYFEDESGVAAIPDTEVRAWSEGEQIHVTGLRAGDNVKVYTTAGVLIAEHAAAEDMMHITAPKDAVYILVITDTTGSKAALKLRH